MKPEHAVAAHDFIVVPFGRAFAAFVGWEAALSVVPSKWLHGRTVDGKDVAMSGVPFVLPFHIVAVVEHLHFDAAQERDAGRSDGCAPDEYGRIAAAAQVPPIDFKDKVFVL